MVEADVLDCADWKNGLYMPTQSREEDSGFNAAYVFIWFQLDGLILYF